MHRTCSSTASLLIILLVLMTAVGNAAAKERKYARSMESYSLPDVSLINQNGEKVRIKSLLNSDKTVVIDFIYGTCTTICPVLSASFVNLQNKLGSDLRKVHLVSISIDPENDNPRVMREYLKRYRAKPGWDFLTGSRSDINNVMKSLDAYIPDKMSHFPLTLIHTPRESKWVRLNGIMSSTEFLAEYQQADKR